MRKIIFTIGFLATILSCVQKTEKTDSQKNVEKTVQIPQL